MRQSQKDWSELLNQTTGRIPPPKKVATKKKKDRHAGMKAAGGQCTPELQEGKFAHFSSTSKPKSDGK